MKEGSSVIAIIAGILIAPSACNMIQLQPKLYVVQIGTSVNFTCTVNYTAVQPLLHNGTISFQWTLPYGQNLTNDDNPIDSIKTIDINSNSSILSISNSEMNDSGVYTCHLRWISSTSPSTKEWSESGELRVYKLSNYFVEGIVILSINAILLVIFMTCTIRQCCSDRHKEDPYKKSGILSSSSPPNLLQQNGDRSNLMERGDTSTLRA